MGLRVHCLQLFQCGLASTDALTLATESSLLQAGPDALDPPSMLRVAVGVPTGTLMLQHQCVIHKTYSGAELSQSSHQG